MLHQQLDELAQLGLVGAQQVRRAPLGLAQQPADVLVDLGLSGFSEWPAGQALATASAEEDRAALRVPDRTYVCRQAELADHLDGQLGGTGQIVGRAGRALAKLHELGRATAEPDGKRIVQEVLAVEVTLVDRQLLGHPERLPGWQDGHLRHRIGVLR